MTDSPRSRDWGEFFSHHTAPVKKTETDLKQIRIDFNMPRPLQLSQTALFAVRDGAQRIGERLSLARKRRRLTLRKVAAKAGISYDTARAVEAGNRPGRLFGDALGDGHGVRNPGVCGL